MAMIPPHVFMIKYGGEESCDENSLFYSYPIIDKLELTRLMGIEMPPIRRGGPDELAQWLAQHQHLPPPTHSPTMLANTNVKITAWRNGYFDDGWNGRSPSRGRGYTPPRYDHRDDSSDDSYHSTAVGNKGTKRNNGSPAGGDCRNDYRGTLYRFQTPNFPRFPESDTDKRHYSGGYQRGRQRSFTPRNHHSSGPIPPERFLSHSHLVCVNAAPTYAVSSFANDSLSKSIWSKFAANQQTVETYKQKILLWKDLFLYIRASFPKFGLYLVGSTMSGLGSNCSDVDMCLSVRSFEMDQRHDALVILGNVAYHLRQSNFVNSVDLIHAKVPILKLKSRDMEIDLNCNNSVGIRNTHLLYCYAKADWRVRPLVLVVKLWAARHDINDAKRMTVSSYSWALMVIHYLQCGVRPSILPCLQKEYKDKFLPYADINQIDLHGDLPALSKSENKESLGKLLLGFFQYYSEFDYTQWAISVRLATKIPIDECRRMRSVKNEPHQWKYLCIEEPFDLTNTARSVFDFGAFERMRRIIKASYDRLKSTKKLDAIFDANFRPL